MRRGRIGLALAACLLTLGACDSQSKSSKTTKTPKTRKPATTAAKTKKPRTTPPPRTRPTAKKSRKTKQPTIHRQPGAIGVFAHLQPSDSSAWLGHQYLDGAQLHLQEFKRSPKSHQFDIHLHEADASKGLHALAGLFAKTPRPVAVIGHVDDKEALAAVERYQEAQVLMLPVAPGGNELLSRSGMSYRITYSDGYYGRSLAALIKKKWNSAVILAGPGAHARDVSETAADFGVSSGLAILERKTAENLEQAGPLAQELVAKNAEVTLVVSRNPKHVLALVKALKKANNKKPIVVSDGGAALDFIQGLREPSVETYVATLFDPTSSKGALFSKSFRKAYARPPDQWSALAYDLVGLFLQSLYPAEVSVNSFERHLRSLSAKNPYIGVTGKIFFNGKMQALARPVHLLNWSGSRFEQTKVALSDQEALDVQAGRASKPIPQTVAWHTSVRKALSAARRSKKPILVDFYSKSSLACKRMAENTWPAKAFRREALEWELLRIDLDETPLYVQIYGVEDLPALGYWTPQGAVAKMTKGVKSAPEMVAEMRENFTTVRREVDRFRRLKEAISNPNDAKAQVALASALYSSKAYLRAAGQYEVAQGTCFMNRDTPSGVQLYQWIIKARSRANDPSGGLRACQSWLKRHPKTKLIEYAYYMAGVFLARQGKRDEARKYWETLLENFPSDNYFAVKAINKLRN